MPLPSSNSISFSSGTTTLRGGKDFSVTVTMEDRVSAAESYGITVSSIGNYEINMDVEEDSRDVTDFVYSVPKFSFSFWDELNGINFSEALVALLNDDLIEIRITYNGSTDLFLCQSKDFSYDREKREVECNCYSVFKYNEVVKELDLDPYFFDIRFEGTLFNGITYRDLVEGFINTLRESDNPFIESNYELTKSDMVDNTPATIALFSNNVTVEPDIEDVRDIVVQTGLAESAIIGTMFGESFYVRRGYGVGETLTENVTASDLEEFDVDITPTVVKSVELTILNAVDGDVTSSRSLSGKYQTINVELEKKVLNVTFEVGTSSTDEGNNAGEISIADLASDGVSSWARVFGGDDTLSYSGTIFGTETIKPYQLLVFNTSVSPFINSSNKIMRPSKLTYNLKEDKIEFEAYSI